MGLADSPLKDRVAFLVGVRRSGTNWLRRIVDAHPDATVIPSETYLLSHGIAPLAERVQHGLRGSARTGTMFVDRAWFRDVLRDLCDELLGGHLETLDQPVTVIAERTPDHVRHLGLVRDVYPDAAVVHIIRDGRDVARSLVSQPWGPGDHREAAREWVTGIEAARAVAPELSRYLEVRYEHLLTDPSLVVPEIYRFLGLQDGREVIDRALAEAEVPYNVDPGAGTVEVQKWRGGLTGAELRAVIDVAGPLLASLGYEDRRTVDLRRLPSRARGSLATVSRLTRRLGQLATRPARPDRFERQVLASMDATMILLDDLLDDVTARRFDRLGRHAAEHARIRVVGEGEAWDERGPAAVERLADVLAHDDALAGRQLRGDVHPGVPAFTVVSTWEAPDGRLLDRVMVVTSFGGRVDELTWYRLPRLG